MIDSSKEDIEGLNKKSIGLNEAKRTSALANHLRDRPLSPAVLEYRGAPVGYMLSPELWELVLSVVSREAAVFTVPDVEFPEDGKLVVAKLVGEREFALSIDGVPYSLKLPSEGDATAADREQVVWRHHPDVAGAVVTRASSRV